MELAEKRLVRVLDAERPKPKRSVPRLEVPASPLVDATIINFVGAIDAPPTETPVSLAPSMASPRAVQPQATKLDLVPAAGVASAGSKRVRSTEPTSTPLPIMFSTDREHPRSTKRSRPTTHPMDREPKVLSKNLQKSRAFTKRLQAMVNGGTHEMLVGHVPLSILLRNAPELVSEDDDEQQILRLPNR